MNSPFQLSVCAEMLWPDKPMAWRCAFLHERGFGVGLWSHKKWDVAELSRLKGRYSIMNGYLQGRLSDDDGAQLLLESVQQTIKIAKRLHVEKLNLHGTGLDASGLPIPQQASYHPRMWLKARDTLERICDLGEQEQVTFTLENLNKRDHPGCPFSTSAEVLELVSVVNRPQLRINLDLYHTQLGEGDVIRWIEACLPWLGEVQIADNPGRCEPGTGEMHYPNIARALYDLGYHGAVGLEAYAKHNELSAIQAFENAFSLSEA